MTDLTSPDAVAKMMEGVTPGPWRCGANRQTLIIHGDHGGRIADTFQSYKMEYRDKANARFIAWTREAVPALSAKLADVTAERDALTGILTRSSDQIRNLARAEAAEAAAAESEGNLAHALHQLDDAEARVTELEALVKAYEDGTVPNLTAVYLAGGKDMADKLKAAEALARDPKHAAKVLLGSDDLTIKPAAKALQDAFGLSGVGWKQYLKAFRAALRAIAGETP